jgi:hypothetical protein
MMMIMMMMMMIMMMKYEMELNLFVETFERVGLLTKDINTYKTNALILTISASFQEIFQL